MAKRLDEGSAKWRVRLAGGEFELDLPELEAWIRAGRVDGADLVRPPVTRRWKKAENSAELVPALNARSAALFDARWAADAPRRAREEAARSRALKRRRVVVALGLTISFGGSLAAVLTTESWEGALAGVVLLMLFGAVLWVPALAGMRRYR